MSKTYQPHEYITRKVTKTIFNKPYPNFSKTIFDIQHWFKVQVSKLTSDTATLIKLILAFSQAIIQNQLALLFIGVHDFKVCLWLRNLQFQREGAYNNSRVICAHTLCVCEALLKQPSGCPCRSLGSARAFRQCTMGQYSVNLVKYFFAIEKGKFK